MAVFKQLKGPFPASEQNLLLNENIVKLGISIGEKDFMKFPSQKDIHGETRNHGVILKINNNQIEIGKTFIYQPGDFFTVSSLCFPEGAPSSTLIDIIYKTPTNMD